MQRLVDQARLRFRRPAGTGWTLAVAEARSVESDYVVLLGSLVEQAAEFEIISEDAFPMQQNHGRPRAALEVMQGAPHRRR
jgi:hypothetical protein